MRVLGLEPVDLGGRPMSVLLPLLVATAALFAATGGGAALLHRLAPRLLSGPAGWLFALGVGGL